MTHGSCLCGSVAWEAEGPFELMSHCHCGRCRKTHGAAFSTALAAPVAGFRLGRGADAIGHYQTSPGFARPFCTRCGSIVADGAPAATEGPLAGRTFMPAGCLDGDPGVRPLAHIFVASRAPWFQIADDLPRFDAYPPGFEAPEFPDLPTAPPVAGSLRGSCACGGVRYLIETPPMVARYCHCSRCRKARAAAHATNLFVAAEGLRFTQGEDRLRRYKVPEADRFAQVFCTTCSSPMPNVVRERNAAVVPMGSLDDDPTMPIDCHIFVGSKAPWYAIADATPQHPEYPPA